jgi:putative DNA primase/helicase
LLGASLVFSDEIPKQPVRDDLLKSLVAGEPVTIDRKHRDHVTTTLQSKWLLLGNRLPNVDDASNGFWRRFDIIGFDIEIPPDQRDANLARKIIDAELGGVLTWALAGLVRLEQRGRFEATVPPAMEKTLQEARMASDTVLAWVTDREVCLGVDAWAPKDAVFAHYVDWCRQNQLQVCSSPVFWKRIRSRMPGLKLRRHHEIPGLPSSTRGCNVDPKSLM